jgi:hypothetical protein
MERGITIHDDDDVFEDFENGKFNGQAKTTCSLYSISKRNLVGDSCRLIDAGKYKLSNEIEPSR